MNPLSLYSSIHQPICLISCSKQNHEVKAQLRLSHECPIMIDNPQKPLFLFKKKRKKKASPKYPP